MTIPFAASALSLKVRIYSCQEISAFNFKVFSGRYVIQSKNKELLNAFREQEVSFNIENNKIAVSKAGLKYGLFDTLEIKGRSFINGFHIAPKNPNIKARDYDDHLILTIENNHLKIINHVDLERYVAGVVQSEGGGSVKDIEFYFVQAVSCRTYALNNFNKHGHEGYHVCDAIHCQAYLGRCTKSDILRAVNSTLGEVIVDEEQKMISAAFHSNSGGQTVNSEDVWTIPTTYLKAKKDTFSLDSRNSIWETKISKKDFNQFLTEIYHYNINDKKKAYQAYNFRQIDRAVYFVDSIPLKVIRKHFNLRSTWFHIFDQGDYLLLKGKGYGHGVGMSQEGAIKMASLGWTYKDIIQYYYTDVSIVNFHQLPYLLRSFEENL